MATTGKRKAEDDEGMCAITAGRAPPSLARRIVLHDCVLEESDSSWVTNSLESSMSDSQSVSLSTSLIAKVAGSRYSMFYAFPSPPDVESTFAPLSIGMIADHSMRRHRFLWDEDYMTEEERVHPIRLKSGDVSEPHQVLLFCKVEGGKSMSTVRNPFPILLYAYYRYRRFHDR